MNVIKLNNFIAEIRASLTEEEIRYMFRTRTNEALFESVGYKAMRTTDLREVPRHIPVWRGYELLLGIEK